MTNLCPRTLRVYGLLNNEHAHLDLCSCNFGVPPKHCCFNTLSCHEWAFTPSPHSLQHRCSSEIKWTLMIGFYIKPAGLERELDRELFWGPEVNMTNLSHSCFFPPPACTSPVIADSLWGPFVRVMWGVKHHPAFMASPIFHISAIHLGYCFSRNWFML